MTPDAVHAELVRRELERVLHSAPFRSSRRCQQLLTYVVTQTLEGDPHGLKERSIGVTVFGRPADYDPGEDATVRVTANDVRKRLAQVYDHENEERPPVRIELVSGSYMPEFRWRDATADSAEAKPKPPRVLSRRTVMLACAVFVVVAVALEWLAFRPAPSEFDRFWAPVVGNAKPVLICMTTPVVYLLSESVQSDYVRKHGIDQLAGPYAVDPKELNLSPSDVIPAPDSYVGAADAFALGRFLLLFAHYKKSTEFRIGNEVSFSDLRSAPAVLIGAYSNRWTMQANRDYRFAFEHFRVVDRHVPGREWKLNNVTPDYKSKEDYAIVTRVLYSYSGEVMIGAAGITQSGTQSAAEFLTDPRQLSAALKGAPAAWWQKNLQFVIYTRVSGDSPGPPKVVAAHFW